MDLYQWQEQAIETIKNKDAIITSPTNTGKTIVAYHWAGIWEGKERVIFTAPIKALSNERYLELKKMGIDVGLQTGDIKRNQDAPVLCCTQEIYTNRYADLPNQKVIIDEMHYISNNPDRARAYVDGLRNTNKDSQLLIMSATFGGVDNTKRYLDRITGKDFTLYQNNERITPLTYLQEGIDAKDIRNSLVFVFSQKGVLGIAEDVANTRDKNSKVDLLKIKTIANELEIENYHPTIDYGVGIYHGKMLPKEKIFTETLYRENLIDTVVGTDALSLGVNLPAETVVFGQLAKFYDGPISKNEFVQMSGRSGRKGYFEQGYVTYLNDNAFYESFDYDTDILYDKLLQAEHEGLNVDVGVDWKSVLNGSHTIKEEAEYVYNVSFPQTSDVSTIYEQIEETVEEINWYAENVFDNSKEMESFKNVLGDLYESELEVFQNIELARKVVQNGKVSVNDHLAVISMKNPNEYYSMMQSLKLYPKMPSGYRSDKNLDFLKQRICEIDKAGLHFDELQESLEKCCDNMRLDFPQSTSSLAL